MKVLTVKNPWAWLIMYRDKDQENRPWYTPYRGPLLIHASKKSDLGAYMRDWNVWRMERIFNEIRERKDEIEATNGCILGEVNLHRCSGPDDGSFSGVNPWAENGAYHWWMKDPKPFAKPIPARGALGLWEYTGELEELA
jgi:hypothetical protein